MLLETQIGKDSSFKSPMIFFFFLMRLHQTLLFLFLFFLVLNPFFQFFSHAHTNEVTHSMSRASYCCTTHTLPHVITTKDEQIERKEKNHREARP